jgi:hypothetical protein
MMASIPLRKLPRYCAIIALMLLKMQANTFDTHAVFGALRFKVPGSRFKLGKP